MGGRSYPVDVQCKSGLQMACNLDQSAMAAGRMEKPARFRRVGACSLIPWQSTDMQRLRRGMKVEVWDAVLLGHPSFSQACNVDQSAMAAGQTEKPARFWRVGACSLIPWQSTDMQRLRRGMKVEVWDAVLKATLFFAGMQCRSKCYGGWPNGETCAVLEGGSVFSDPLAVD